MNWTSSAHIRDQVQMPGGSSLIHIQFNPSSSSVCVCVCVCVLGGGLGTEVLQRRKLRQRAAKNFFKVAE